MNYAQSLTLLKKNTKSWHAKHMCAHGVMDGKSVWGEYKQFMNNFGGLTPGDFITVHSMPTELSDGGIFQGTMVMDSQGPSYIRNSTHYFPMYAPQQLSLPKIYQQVIDDANVFQHNAKTKNS